MISLVSVDQLLDTLKGVRRGGQGDSGVEAVDHRQNTWFIPWRRRKIRSIQFWTVAADFVTQLVCSHSKNLPRQLWFWFCYIFDLVDDLEQVLPFKRHETARYNGVVLRHEMKVSASHNTCS